jgi:hypothetical protein
MKYDEFVGQVQNRAKLASREDAVMTIRGKYIGTSRFWFESFQNWHSEFFIYWHTGFLHQKGSPESKRVC